MEALGAVVVDTDGLAHEAMRPGAPAYERILALFGRSILLPTGQIDRRALGSLVFGDESKRLALNAIVHPEVDALCQARLAQCEAEGRAWVVVLIPLLFEAGWQEGWDCVVCVTCSQQQQLMRLGERGLSDAEARRRIAAQLPLEEKARRSDVVLENSGTVEDLRERTRVFVAELMESKHGREKRQQ